MNRFRNKKKSAKEANEAAGRVSNDSDPPQTPHLKTSMTFKRGKKNAPAPEPKVELDLSTALPSSDDFRTSLLMSGLSARFSMLREQDDPNSKLGKASDDSVLSPKRQSRLPGLTKFAPNGLSDIAEVSSIRSSTQFFRPPFAISGRADSFHSVDGYGTDDDSAHGSSIMGRAKPGEGNNLFGGRQKVYHIPVKAGGDEDSKGAGMRGRARYGDDISQSAFQRFKDRERQQREYDEEQARLAEDAASTARSTSPPPSGYNRNRETSSTTSSGPTNTRTSTAATSINSQGNSANVLNTSTTPANVSINPSGSERSTAAIPGLERTVTKNRRLYETGLEKDLHEQQYSAMNRIDSLSRQQNLRSQTPPLTLRSPASSSNLSDRFERREISTKQSQASLRTVSPPPSASILGTFDLGIKTTNPPGSHSQFGEPPLSPPMSEGDDTLSSNFSIDAKDRGKATALGTFNKPAHSYDDTKYSERQMQMKAGRETPQKFRPSPSPNAGRNRAESNATVDSSRFESTTSVPRQPFVPRKRIPEMRSAEPKIALPSPPRPAAFHAGPGQPTNSAIENQGFDRKPTDVRNAEEKPAGSQISLERPAEFQRPANRPTQRLWADFTEDNTEQDLPNPSILLSKTDARKGSVEECVDSPTLGPTPGMSGLSGMVRRHMRTDSTASSFFGVPSPGLTSRFPQDSGNPWDLEDGKRDQANEPYSPSRRVKGMNRLSVVPPPLSLKSAKLEPVSLDEEIVRPSPLANRSPNVETFRTEEAGKPAYEKDVLAHHRRDGSSQTQKESQNFANELAERRRRVQENLKSFVESDSRSNSPVPELDWTKEVSRIKSNPLGILKPKSSRESIVGNAQVKTRRMLGLGNTTINSSTSPNKPFYDDDDFAWQKEEEEMLRGLAKRQNPSSHVKDSQRAHREERQASEKYWAKESEGERSDLETQNVTGRRKFSEENQPQMANKVRHRQERQEADEQVIRKPSQESKDSASSSGQSRPSSRAARDRSSSATSGRSKSRNGMYRDDLAKAMAEGLSSTTQAMYGETSASRLPARSPVTPMAPIMASPMNGPSSRSGSNNRPPPPNPAGSYFNKHNLHPLQTGDITQIGSSPRPSPVTPFSVNSTPSLTPSADTQAQGFQTQGRVLARKKTINKADISEPTLVSRTSQFDTVNLPPGASLKNGAEPAPPVPPINPRRRQTRIQTMVGVFSANKSSDSVPTMPSSSKHSPIEDQSTFSADENDVKKPRKLRKSSSEGGSLRSRSRQNSHAPPNPAIPSGNEQGGMF